MSGSATAAWQHMQQKPQCLRSMLQVHPICLHQGCRQWARHAVRSAQKHHAPGSLRCGGKLAAARGSDPPSGRHLTSVQQTSLTRRSSVLGLVTHLRCAACGRWRGKAWSCRPPPWTCCAWRKLPGWMPPSPGMQSPPPLLQPSLLPAPRWLCSHRLPAIDTAGVLRWPAGPCTQCRSANFIVAR